MLSTRKVILLVARSVILEIKTGRCASGNVVLGAGAELVRFMLAAMLGPAPLVNEDEGIIVVIMLGVGKRRSGRGGTANVGGIDVVSLVTFVCLFSGVETKVNGSIGYGVSIRRMSTNIR
jgi:hypothetical protein